jgi:hypothetical protein
MPRLWPQGGFEIELCERLELAAGIHHVAHPEEGEGVRLGFGSRGSSAKLYQA